MMIKSEYQVQGKALKSGLVNSCEEFLNMFLDHPPPGNENTWRYVSLITLTLQNAILGLSMRYARTRPGDLFLSSTGKYESGQDLIHNSVIPGDVDMTFGIMILSELVHHL